MASFDGGSYLASLVITTKLFPDFTITPPWEDMPTSASTGRMEKDHAQGIQKDGEDEQRNYGAFQNELYKKGMFDNILPRVTTDPNKLEQEARKCLKNTAYNYVAGGAGECATMDANRLAFRQWKLIPRMLRNTSRRELRVNLFGEEYESPILMAPIGVQSVFHDDKETGLSEVCAEIGVPYILSTASSSSIEEVAESNGNGRRWYQLYWPQDKDVTVSLLNRAKNNGYKVLVVTLDTWALAWRPADLDGAYLPFVKGTGNRTGFTDPVFRQKFESKFGKTVEEDITNASREWTSDVFPGISHTWDEISHLRQNWGGPIVLKGIQHPDDARLAIQAGVDGIIVSNHGGRQLDGAVGSLEMLPEIVSAIKEEEHLSYQKRSVASSSTYLREGKTEKGYEFTVLFDSGIRTGVDVIKALALGAKAVLVGRPAIYGLAVGGKLGAKQVLQGLLSDLDQSMGLAGIKSVEEIVRGCVRRVEYGGDLKSSN